MWKKISDFENYMVSSDGLVKSLSRYVDYNRWDSMNCRLIRERILKPGIVGNGYLNVILRDGKRAYNKRVHVLVAEAFLGDRPDGMIIHHKNGDKLDNRVENLEYVPHYVNTREWHKQNGTITTGKVPIGDIIKIKDRVNNGEKIYNIASEYNVSRDDIKVIVSIIALTGKELMKKQS